MTNENITRIPADIKPYILNALGKLNNISSYLTDLSQGWDLVVAENAELKKKLEGPKEEEKNDRPTDSNTDK